MKTLITRESMIKRIELLRLAISYSRDTQKIMSITEGIMCHQEIASWFGVMDYRTKYPRYVVTDEIETKIKQIQEKIKETNWIKPEIF